MGARHYNQRIRTELLNSLSQVEEGSKLLQADYSKELGLKYIL